MLIVDKLCYLWKTFYFHEEGILGTIRGRVEFVVLLREIRFGAPLRATTKDRRIAITIERLATTLYHIKVAVESSFVLRIL